MDEQPELVEGAKAVLEMNYRGNFTVPAPHLYPHQWLWDSCFIAIGLRHTDIDRAQKELLSLARGQWHNGMIPNMIFTEGNRFSRDRTIWNSAVNPNSPDDIATSGITQPPLLAEAVVKVGEKLKKAERRSWYKQMYPIVLKYHEWLYTERDPHDEGLVLQIHPWETGLDNTPPWMSEMHAHQLANWIRVVKKLHLGPVVNIFRRDTQRIPAAQRINIIDALGLFSTQRRLRRKGYDIDKVLRHSLFSIEDLTFNCIFIRANQHLVEITNFLHEELPEELSVNMKKTEQALEQLWDPYTGQYYSRDFVTHRLIKEPSLATLMPLYAGILPPDRVKQLVRLLENQHVFGTNFPVPSVPLNSAWFDPDGYWQGPTWFNTNWLIIDGLRRMGYTDHAAALTQSTLDLARQHGFYEYFDPNSGNPAGAPDFSWTAALTIDLEES
jgi:glycogen debranching enzyme